MSVRYTGGVPAIGPYVPPFKALGPDIDVPGWGERFTTPYVLPAYDPTWHQGPWGPNQLQGRSPRGRHYAPESLPFCPYRSCEGRLGGDGLGGNPAGAMLLSGGHILVAIAALMIWA